MTGGSDKGPWQHHATTIALNGKAVMLCGPSGAGKSDLALRLIDRGAKLVADDRTDLVLEGDQLIASAPVTIRGKLEIRGLGILRLDFLGKAPVHAVINLVPRDQVPRLPERKTVIFGPCALPALDLHGFDASAAVKVELLLQLVMTGQIDREYPAAILAPKQAGQ